MDAAASVGRVGHLFNVQGIVFAGGADLDLANELVTLVSVGRQLVAEVRLVMFLGPTRYDILLAAFGRPPLGRHRAFPHDFLFLLADRLLGSRDDAGVDHLTTARDVAVLGELAINRVKDTFAGARLDQPFLENPDCRPVRNLATVAQADKALITQAIKQLEFHLLIRQIEHLLNQQQPHHHLGRERRATAAQSAGTRRGLIYLGSQRHEIDMLLQHLQRVAELIQLRFTLLVRKQTGFDHQIRLGWVKASSCHHLGSFSRCPFDRLHHVRQVIDQSPSRRVSSK